MSLIGSALDLSLLNSSECIIERFNKPTGDGNLRANSFFHLSKTLAFDGFQFSQKDKNRWQITEKNMLQLAKKTAASS